MSENEELSEMAVMQDLKRVRRIAERRHGGNRLLQRTTKNVRDRTIREGGCSTNLFDQLVKELGPKYVSLRMIIDE